MAMKTNQTIHTLRSAELAGRRCTNMVPFPASARTANSQPRRAFTLIELLVVISIIAVLSAFAIPVLKSVARKKVLDRTRAEMAQLQTALESYKATYGFYPPSNPKNPGSPLINPLYFELLGTTNNSGIYQTLDGSATIGAGAANMNNAFGLSGFINCSKVGAGEDSPAAKNFLPGLSTGQIGSASNNTVLVTCLIASVGGPDVNYKPFFGTPNFNPWRYVNPGVNNPNSYDLWVQLVIGGRTNLVCNWSKLALLNNPLP
jgi:prepilin-type N-terminal cleavage/methylation domain-containing protein